MRLRSRVGSFVRRLRRRGVLRAAAVYTLAAWIAVQVAAATFPALPVPDWAHTLVVVLAIFGLPVVVAVSWAYEITPEGVRRTVEESQPPELLKARGTPWTSLLLVGVVTVSSAGLGWASWQLWLRPSREPVPADTPSLPRTRVAVLPFDGAGPVADGLTLSLNTSLDRIPVLDVISHRGVRPYADSDVPLDSIARELNAGSLVTGAVRAVGDSLVVTMQLVDGRTSSSDWSSPALRASRDSLLALRDETLDEVVRGLRLALGEELEAEQSQAGANSDEAWELYYRARGLAEEGTRLRRQGQRAVAADVYARADSLLAEAEELDSDWLDPTIERGWLELDRAQLPGRELARMDPERLRIGIEHAGRAVASSGGAPTAVELRGALLNALSQLPGIDSSAALRERAMTDLRDAVSGDTERARAWAELSDLYRREARFEDARLAARKASEADAFLINESVYLQKATQLALDVGEYREALALARRGRELFPQNGWWDLARLVALAAEGAPTVPPETAWSVLARYERQRGRPDPILRLQVAAVLARHGLADSARAVLHRSMGAVPERARPFAWYYEANVRLHLGQRERALALLRRYLDANPDQRAWVAQDGYWASLRDDPGFRSLVGPEASEAAGLPQ